jgi:hypothetical protein
MIYHDIVRLDVSMENVMAVRILDRSQQLKHVKSHIVICQSRIEISIVRVVDILCDDGDSFIRGVLRKANDLKDAGSGRQLLEHSDLSFHVFEFNCLEDFGDITFIVSDINHSIHICVCTFA